MNKTNKTLKIAGTAFIIVIIAAAVAIKYKNKDETENTITQTTEVNQEFVATGSRKYADGEYYNTGEYTSPAGTEIVGVTLIIQNDIVTSSSFTGDSKNPTSARIQEAFNNGFSQFVVGKPIDEISLTVVNGSSLTPKGFMEAVEKIKLQAKVS